MSTSDENLTSYSQEIAEHYAAYRPPLHAKILENCLGRERFSFGLDIGCGTGCSTLALGRFCDQVMGIEPSEAMLSKAIKSPNIEFRLFNGNQIPAPDNRFDLITFAGSLFYAESLDLLAEMTRTLQTPATIIVYDFEVNLTPVFDLVGHPPAEPYNHEINLDHMRLANLTKGDEEKYPITFNASREEVAHLALSSNPSLKFFQLQYQCEHPYDQLFKDLQLLFTKQFVALNSSVYSSLYKVK